MTPVEHCVSSRSFTPWLQPGKPTQPLQRLQTECSPLHMYESPPMTFDLLPRSSLRFTIHVYSGIVKTHTLPSNIHAATYGQPNMARPTGKYLYAHRNQDEVHDKIRKPLKVGFRRTLRPGRVSGAPAWPSRLGQGARLLAGAERGAARRCGRRRADCARWRRAANGADIAVVVAVGGGRWTGGGGGLLLLLLPSSSLPRGRAFSPDEV